MYLLATGSPSRRQWCDKSQAHIWWLRVESSYWVFWTVLPFDTLNSFQLMGPLHWTCLFAHNFFLRFFLKFFFNILKFYFLLMHMQVSQLATKSCKNKSFKIWFCALHALLFYKIGHFSHLNPRWCHRDDHCFIEMVSFSAACLPLTSEECQAAIRKNFQSLAYSRILGSEIPAQFS